MRTISLRIPDSLHRQIRKLADQDGISINQFISTAAAEKLAALMTVNYLAERAKRGSRERFEEAVTDHPKFPPCDHLKIPPSS
jgi:hypothetical protein